MYTLIGNKELQLSNGQVVLPEVLEYEIRKICHYVQHVVLTLKDGQSVIALIFPNKALFSKPDYEQSPEEGCFCPRTLGELGRCLSGCMHSINTKVLPGKAKIQAAVIINTGLSVSDGTLDQDLNIIPENVIKKYNDHLENLFGARLPVTEEVFNMKM